MPRNYANKSSSRSASRKLVRTTTIEAHRRAPKSSLKLYASLNDKTCYVFKRITNARLLMNSTNGLSGSTSYGLTTNFQLSNVVLKIGASTTTQAVPSAGEFTALFDQWRIKQVKVRVGFSNTVSNTGSTTTSVPPIYMAEDMDGSAGTTSLAEIQQKQGVKMYQLGPNGAGDNYRSMIVKPRPANAVYQGGVFTGYSEITKNLWLDCAYPAIENYGFRLYWDPDYTAASVDIGYLNLIFEIVYEFRGVQ